MAKKLKPRSDKFLTSDQETSFNEPSTSGQSNNCQVPKITVEELAQPVTSPKEKSKLALFAERVTVAGLEEAYGSNVPADRCMFRLAIILSIVGIGFSAAICAAKYLNRGSALGGLEVTGIQAPFPNVTVCGPESSKRDLLRRWIIDYDDAKELLGNSQLTLDETVENFASLASYNLRYRPFQKIQKIMLKIIDNFLDKQKLGLSGFYSLYPLLYSTCSEMFSKCMFGTRAFNCCDATELLLFDGMICFQFSMTRLSEVKSTPEIKGGRSNDAIKIDSSGLTVDVRIDWPNVIFWDNLASDGFNVFVGPLPSQWSTNPIAIPSDMDAMIVLKPPKLVSELEGCRSDGKLPFMLHSRYYDPYAVNCIYEEIVKHGISVFGCAIPPLNFAVDNKTECNLRQSLVLYSIFNGDFAAQLKEASEDMGTLKTLVETMVKQESMMTEIGRLAFGKCLPFCTRYTYDVLSASYGSLQRRGQAEWSGSRPNNQSWSRIRVFFPQASYTIHKEDYLSPAYMAVCEIGGIVGVYLGASMITLLQVLFYGFLICVSFKKPNRVSPS